MSRPNILSALNARRLGILNSPTISDILELSFLQCPIASDLALHSHQVLSTIAISISHDGYYIATTHGDHTVKIFTYHSSQQVQVLIGHPRYYIRHHNYGISYNYIP